MDKRSQASLTYRILTEMLGLALVLGAFAVSMMPEPSVRSLLRYLAIYAIVFAVLAVVWWRLGSMFSMGILMGKTSMMAGMVVAFNIALAPLFLRLLVSATGGVGEMAAAFMTASFVLITSLLAVAVNRSTAYRSKAQWRLIHHSLWLMSGIFLLSLFIPFSRVAVMELPWRFLVWVLALIVPAVYRLLATRYVAMPARPPVPGFSPQSVSSNSPPSMPSREATKEERLNQQQAQHRRPRRGRYRHHRPGGPRRRM
jgi:hypothetical protein